MRLIACLTLTFACLANASAQEPETPSDTSPIVSIEKLLTAQVQCWNNKDIDGFMDTYWKSPKLTFSSGGKTTRGWQATLDRYKKKYPPEKMGTLKFDQLEVSMLTDGVAMVLGNWSLTQSAEPNARPESKPESKPDAQGNFSIVLKKIDEDWKIVHDHSSALSE